MTRVPSVPPSLQLTPSGRWRRSQRSSRRWTRGCGARGTLRPPRSPPRAYRRPTVTVQHVSPACRRGEARLGEPLQAFAGWGGVLGAARCQPCPSSPSVPAVPGDEPDPAKEAAFWERVREVTEKAGGQQDSTRVSLQRPQGRHRAHWQGRAGPDGCRVRGAVSGSCSITPSPSHRQRTHPQRQPAARQLVSPQGSGQRWPLCVPLRVPWAFAVPILPTCLFWWSPCRYEEENPFQSDQEPRGPAPVHRRAEGEHQEGG